ncbi:pitrilysin family protein [Pseudogemmatithrix spongiicola]|uniref:Pitrilysin family protein n=1 Tax=Pseudogemmatithrix spongiicola TaxID=3062599 RepID=A0AA49K2E2_9BACT|nr:pitrilysin family protein [Gemmatimonadaceae bacterium 'strain 138']WKW16537.1 pitrilysin family protein [Gemmatimonadaceae bacterium 'strain 318']
MSVALRPAPGQVRSYRFPDTDEATLPNGLRVIVARMPRLPIVTVLALVDAGAVDDPEGREGLAALTARALAEGSGALDGAAIADRFEGWGTSFDASVDWDSTVARVTVTPSRLEAAFGLFAEVLRAPAFPAADVARKRDERLDDLTQLLAEPRGLADVRFTGTLFAGARYGRPIGGSARSVPGLDAEMLRAFHRAHYGPRTTTLFFVGDITLDAAVALAERAMGDWASDARASRRAASAAPQARETRRTRIITKADAPQSELRVGHVGIARGHPDYLAIVVMNAILGGLFSSRINLNLRERHAFTYGASSGFDARRAAGPFVVSTAVKSEVTDRAVQEILREIDALRAAPPSAAELSLATEYLAGVFPIRFETTAAVAGALAGATVHGLGADWFRTYRDRVQAVTDAEVHRVAREQLDPSRLLVLAVGDPTAIAAPLQALGHGDFAVLSATDDPSEQP